MARWKARVEFLLSVIELGAKISGGRGRPWWIFFGFYKTRHILLSNSANCTMLRAIVLTQYRRVRDRQTDRWTDRRTELPQLVQRLQCKHCGVLYKRTVARIRIKYTKQFTVHLWYLGSLWADLIKSRVPCTKVLSQSTSGFGFFTPFDRSGRARQACDISFSNFATQEKL